MTRFAERPGLCVFVQPMWSKQEINGDSLYIAMTILIREMLRQRPDWYFVIPFPDAKSGFAYVEDGFFAHPNIVRIPQRVSPRKMASAVSYSGEWYDRVWRTFGFDVAWVNLVEIAPHIARAGTSVYEEVSRPVVVASHHYVIHKSLPYPIDPMVNVQTAQIMGSVVADVNVANSHHCRAMLLDNCREYLNEKRMTQVADKIRIIHHGTLETNFPEPEWRDNEVPIIVYNHRLQTYKNYQTTFDLFDRLYDSGLRFKMRFTSDSPDNLSRVTSRPYAEARLCAKRSEYLEAIRGCDLNVTNSQHETFCMSAVESMALGQPLVAPQGVTFPEITGQRETKYPYLFQNLAEQETMVRKLLTDAQERRKWGAILSRFVRDRFNGATWAEAYGNLFLDECAKRKLNISEDVIEPLYKRLKEMNGQDVKTAQNWVWSMRVAGRIPLSSQSFCLTKMIRAVRHFGGRVTIERGVQKIYL